MEYFRRLADLLKIEKEEDRQSYKRLAETLSVADRRQSGITWYPIAIRDTEMSRGDYLTVELERTTHHDIIHQFRFGMSAALFSNHDPANDRVEGTISYLSGNKLKLTLRTDELPEWARDGKLGVDAVFDENSYTEMENALRLAQNLDERSPQAHLQRVLTGQKSPGFAATSPVFPKGLNQQQHEAVSRILSANELAIVHGPPGTGKTTTLVQAIRILFERDRRPILVVAPSNAAVDLLTEKLSEEGLNVLRVGNPARVSERLMELTLDGKMAAHANMKEVKRLKKQASQYRDMAHKYKRNFGKEEREQRRALFAEAKSVSQLAEKTEQYIADDLIGRAQVITATLVGANHYTVRNLKYGTVVIDEAGQALEPACWIPILKAEKLILAGDHLQLPPTIKSAAAAAGGLSETLLEKCVALHPEAVVMLEEQYRMNEAIMSYPSTFFYKGRLKANPSVAHWTLFEGDRPLTFIDTAGCGFDEKWEGPSLSNGEEAAFLLKHLDALVADLTARLGAANLPQIAVVSPYKHQVEVLKEQLASWPNLREGGTRISVNTIDSFQGQERDVVYISMTRSNTENVIGFLSDVRRMNVAMTRAKKKLVVVGDSATLSQLPFYADFISHTQDRDSYQSAWEFMG